MSLRDGAASIARHGMRAYYVPLAAGVLLAGSAFMPWLAMGERRFGGVPDIAGIWVLGMGVLAAVLAILSVVTRKNSRHPLLLVGLAAFGILLAAEQLLEQAVADQAWARSQARAIVAGSAVGELPEPVMAFGAYVGLAASAVIVLFGLTIVVKRVSQPYAEPEDDDI